MIQNHPLRYTATRTRWLAALLLVVLLVSMVNSVLSQTFGSAAGYRLDMDVCTSSATEVPDDTAPGDTHAASNHACCPSQCGSTSMLPPPSMALLVLAAPATLVPVLFLTGPHWRAVWSPRSGRGPPR